MVKITIVDGGGKKRIVVEGKLAGPGVAELESTWKQARRECEGCEIVVDLSGTTVIDSSGKAMLVAMAGERARLFANGVFTKYLIENLVHEKRDNDDSRCEREQNN
jgi:riboflavin synthase